jgi:hypothetical protein
MKPDREVTFNQSPNEENMEIPVPVIPTVPQGVKQTTLIVDLPSRGLFYLKDNPLSSGQVELRYMTAKDEDILTNQNYIMQGTAIERMFRNLLVSEIDWDDLLVGDKNAIMIASRIAAYGDEYVIQVTTPSGNTQDTTINLSDLKAKAIDESVLVTKNSNLFKLNLPKSKKEVHVKLLTGKEDKEIDAIVKSYEKVGKDPGLLTLRLKHMIVAIDGNMDLTTIRNYIDTDLLAADSRAIRSFISKIQPDVDFNVEVIDRYTGEPFRTPMVFDERFFWPDLER